MSKCSILYRGCKISISNSRNIRIKFHALSYVVVPSVMAIDFHSVLIIWLETVWSWCIEHISVLAFNIAIASFSRLITWLKFSYSPFDIGNFWCKNKTIKWNPILIVGNQRNSDPPEWYHRNLQMHYDNFLLHVLNLWMLVRTSSRLRPCSSYKLQECILN